MAGKITGAIADSTEEQLLVALAECQKRERASQLALEAAIGEEAAAKCDVEDTAKRLNAVREQLAAARNKKRELDEVFGALLREARAVVTSIDRLGASVNDATALHKLRRKAAEQVAAADRRIADLEAQRSALRREANLLQEKRRVLGLIGVLQDAEPDKVTNIVAALAAARETRLDMLALVQVFAKQEQQH